MAKKQKKPKSGPRKKGNQNNNRGNRRGNPKPKFLKSVLFTETAISFNKAARALDAAIKQTYGPQVTISDLSACLAEIKAKKVSPGKVKIHKDLLALWVTYCKQQAKRKADKQSFLAAFEISNIEADFENIGEIFTEKKENNE